MSTDVDWGAVVVAHEDDGTGRCSRDGDLFPCHIRSTADLMCRAEEQSSLPVFGDREPSFVSVFAEVTR